MPKDNEKKGHEQKGKSPIPNAKQFTSQYQPTPEAKSEGQRKKWEYRKARKKFFEELCKKKIKSTQEGDFWDEVASRIEEMIFGEKIDASDFIEHQQNGFTFLGNKLTAKERSDLILKLCKEFMPEDKKKIELDVKAPIVIIDSNDAKL